MVRTRNPTETRERLLEAAFSEIHENGYLAANMDTVVERAGVTRGALYHHFGSKKGLAQAVIGGPIREMVVESFLGPLSEAGNVIDRLQACLNAKVDELTPELVACGCPLNNLAQELSASDDDFRTQIDDLYESWWQAIADAFTRGQKRGDVRADVVVTDVATFLVAAMAGTAGFAKSTQDVEVARTSMRVMCAYLDSLRTPQTQTQD